MEFKPWMAGLLAAALVIAAIYFIFFSTPLGCTSTLYADPSQEFVEKCNAAGGSVRSTLSVRLINNQKTCLYLPECSATSVGREELPPSPPGERAVPAEEQPPAPPGERAAPTLAAREEAPPAPPS